MLRGLYTAAAGMMTQQSRHDTATQNLVNINTPGYKEVTSVNRAFPEVLISMIGGNAENPNKQIGKLNTGVFAEESLSMYKQGVITESTKPTDFALVSDLEVKDPVTGENIPFSATGKYIDDNGDVIYKPQAFFTVQDEQGELRYTADGSFRVSQDGHLLTQTGYQVLDNENRPIVLTGSPNDFKVDEQGRIFDPVAGEFGPNRINITVVNNPGQMVREGNGVFRIDDTREADVRALAAADRVEVRQKYVEQSNVNPSDALVDMNSALRAYEANQKVIQFYDRSLDKAVNEIGRV